LLDPDEVANTGTWTDRARDSDPRSEPEVSRIALAIGQPCQWIGPQGEGFLRQVTGPAPLHKALPFLAGGRL